MKRHGSLNRVLASQVQQQANRFGLLLVLSNRSNPGSNKLKVHLAIDARLRTRRAEQPIVFEEVAISKLMD